MLKRLRDLLGFNRHSATLFSGFLLTCFLIVYIWWPLVEEYFLYFDGRYAWYVYIDWLLLGIFGFMSLTIMARANLRVDALIILVGMGGGLVIESWGTQTNLWHYYTAERPPLWIIPAWPIASLSIDRITRSLGWATAKWSDSIFRALYWPVMGIFYLMMMVFVAPTFDKPYTWVALVISALMILTPPSQRTALLVFLAGSALGYFLELWGTTRECWTYYTNETPPAFAVFAHGMAAVAFWRTGLLVEQVWGKIVSSPKISALGGFWGRLGGG